MSFSFIDSYVRFCSEFTDASKVYLRFAAISLVGTCLGSRVRFSTGDASVYPNIWVVLVGSSSSCRKSTTISIAQRLLEEVSPELVMPGSMTTEALYTRLATKPNGCMFHSEFLAFLEGLRKEYNSNLKSSLTDFYDVPSMRIRETMKATYTIHKPCISMMGGTTVEWFLDQADDADFAGGFLPRFILVPPGVKDKSLPLPPPADQAARKWIVRWLKGCLSKVPECTYLLENEGRYVKWYDNLMEELGRGAQTYEAYGHRLATNALKLAMIYHVASCRLDAGQTPPLVIPDETLGKALAETTWLFEVGERIFSEELGTSAWLKKRKVVLKALRKNNDDGGMHIGDILAQTRMRPREQKEVLQALVLERRVMESQINPEHYLITHKGATHSRGESNGI